ncbi:MAG: GNAT family protein [Caldilineaceae bacterium]
MQIQIIPVNEAQVRAFLAWRYPPPYDVYNLDADDADASPDYFLEPAVACHALVDETDELIGFCTFGKDGQVPGGDYGANALDIGMGMRPDLTGQGHGALFRDAVIAFALHTFAPSMLRVTIADFNQRAKRVWEQAGFEPIQRFCSDFSKLEFVLLVKRYS